MGGVDYSIAICPTCNRIVEPTGIRRSKAGTHGEDFYVHEHRLRFVDLYQSNSGHRRFWVDVGLEHLEGLVELSWIYLRDSTDKVKEKIAEKLKEVRQR